MSTELVSQWYTAREALKQAKATELKLRNAVCEIYFTDPTEGTNTYVVADNRIEKTELKCKHVINRKVDQSMLQIVADNLQEHAPSVCMQDLLVYKPDLDLKAYRNLSENERAIFDECLIIKEGTPGLELKHKTF